MVAQFLNSAIVVLLILLVVVPATMAIAKTMRESAARRQTAQERDRRARPLGVAQRSPDQTTSPKRPTAGQLPKQRESSQVYRRLRERPQNTLQTKPGDRAGSQSEPPPRG